MIQENKELLLKYLCMALPYEVIIEYNNDSCVETREMGLGGYHDIKNTKPATKEQRDLLFSKIEEAGYKWDAEKKELKKIEQKPTDEEMKILLQTEYEKGKADAIEAAMESVTKDKESAIKFLKSAGIMNENGELAKEYVVDNIEQNHAWSEEDEKILKGIIDDIQSRLEDYPTEQLADIYFKEISWLKFIKQRMKGE